MNKNGLKATIGYIIANVIQKIVVFLCMPILTRKLTLEQYGQYELYKSWYSFFLAIASLNLFYSGYNAGITRYEEDSNNFTSAFCGLSLLLCVLFSVFFFIIPNNTFSLCYKMSMCLEIVGYTMYSFWLANQRFFLKYKGVIISSIAISLLNAIASITCVTMLPQNERLFAKVYTDAFLYVGVGIFSFGFLYKNSAKLFNATYWKFGLKNNIPLIPHYLSSIILSQSDKIMISYYYGNNETGVYGLAYSIGMVLLAVTTAIQNAINPFLYRAIRSNRTKKIRKYVNLIILLVGVFVSLLSLIVPEVILFMATQEYYKGVYLAPIIEISVFFIFLYNIFSCIEHYACKSKNILIATCLGAIANITLNIILIPRYGYLVAGVTTLISYILMAVMHNIFAIIILKKENIESYWSNSVVLFVSAFVFIVMIITEMMIELTTVRFVIALIFGMIVFCLLLYVKKYMNEFGGELDES